VVLLSVIAEGVRRGNIKFKGYELREYETMIRYIMEHPGASRSEIRKEAFKTKKNPPISMYLALGKEKGVIKQVPGGYVVTDQGASE
jgi:hypothetical protein